MIRSTAGDSMAPPSHESGLGNLATSKDEVYQRKGNCRKIADHLVRSVGEPMDSRFAKKVDKVGHRSKGRAIKIAAPISHIEALSQKASAVLPTKTKSVRTLRPVCEWEWDQDRLEPEIANLWRCSLC